MQTMCPSTDAPLMVACLCAAWCGTCRDYQPLFLTLQAQFPDLRFCWIDVEDEADLVDPIEVDNFPTLLIARPRQLLFFGTLTPHIETLQRLITASLAPDARALDADADLSELVVRLWRRTSA